MRKLSSTLRNKLFASLGLASLACAPRGSDRYVPPQGESKPRSLHDAPVADAMRPSRGASPQTNASATVAPAEIPPAEIAFPGQLEGCGPDSFVDSICRVETAVPLVHYKAPFERCSPDDAFDLSLSQRAQAEQRGRTNPKICCYSTCTLKGTRRNVLPFPNNDECPKAGASQPICSSPNVWVGSSHYPRPFDGCAPSERFSVDESRARGLCCYLPTCVQPHRGRALRDAWGTADLPAVPAQLLAHASGDIAWWTATARAEYASIAAFARLAVELDALGAPRALVDGCAFAKRDEIAHAKIAFEILTSISNEAIEPGRFSTNCERPSPTLQSLAIENFRDGCIGETASILVLLAKAERESSASVAEALRRFAHDETRHAALAWRITEWAIAKEPTLISVLQSVLESREREIVAALRFNHREDLRNDLAAELETVGSLAPQILSALVQRHSVSAN